MNLGQYNELTIKRLVDFGLYLADDQGNEVLLPARYVTPEMRIGGKARVFVYTDSEDRPVATTEKPFAVAGEFAYMSVAQVNRFGAFLDWGLVGKQLLVPFREQKVTMRQGCQYLVYVYLDDVSKRVVASAKVEKFLGNVLPEFAMGTPVKALVVGHGELGWRVIVDNLFSGLIYENEVYAPLEIGTVIDARVKRVRDDGKLDISLHNRVGVRLNPINDRILELLRRQPDGVLPLSDHSSPEQVKQMLQCSKKDFKRALGHLYKHRLIEMLPDDGGIRLAHPTQK